MSPNHANANPRDRAICANANARSNYANANANARAICANAYARANYANANARISTSTRSCCDELDINVIIYYTHRVAHVVVDTI